MSAAHRDRLVFEFPLAPRVTLFGDCCVAEGDCVGVPVVAGGEDVVGVGWLAGVGNGLLDVVGAGVVAGVGVDCEEVVGALGVVD